MVMGRDFSSLRCRVGRRAWSVSVGMFVLAWGLVAWGTVASAQLIIDTFEDGRAADGVPVTWLPLNGNGVSQMVPTTGLGSVGLRMDSTPNAGTFVMVATQAGGKEILEQRDWSIRALVTVEAGIRAGVGLSHDESAAPTVRRTFGGTGQEIVLRVSDAGSFFADRTFPYQLGQDVWVQYDGIGDTITGSMWLPNNPTDVISLTVNRSRNIANIPGLFSTLNSSGIFKEVWFDSEPIPLPSTSSYSGVIPVGGIGTIAQLSVGGPSLQKWTFGSEAAATGLTHRWYRGSVPDFFELRTKLQAEQPLETFVPANVPSQWWHGNGGEFEPSTMVPYFAEVDHPTILSSVEGNESFSNYTAVLTGEIFIPESGVYKFKDGVDDFASLRIDLDGDGVFQQNELLLNDNDWTTLPGNANGGSPIIERQITVPEGGRWMSIEFAMSEGGGGDNAVLMWDYDVNRPGGTGIGKGAAKGFPAAQDAPPGNGLIAIDQALDAIAIPNSHLRTRGVPTVTSESVLAKLSENVVYEFDIHSRSFTDQLVAGPLDDKSAHATLDVNRTRFKITSLGDLNVGDTIKLVDADQILGTPEFEFPPSTSWNVSRFGQTGEITLVSRDGLGLPLYDGDLDRDVDSADLLGFLEAWTGAMATAEGAAGAGGNHQDVAQLIYDPATGEVRIVPASGQTVVGFSLAAAGKAAELPLATSSLTVPWESGGCDCWGSELGSVDLSFRGTSAAFSLGRILAPGLPADSVEDLLADARYLSHVGAAVQAFELVVVPEPAAAAWTLFLGMLSGWGWLRPR